MTPQAETAGGRGRVVIAAAAVPAVVAAAFGPAWIVRAVLLGVIGLAGYEFGTIARLRGARVQPALQSAVCIAAAGALYATTLAAPGTSVWLAVAAVGGVVLVTGLRHVTGGVLSRGLAPAHVVALGALYAGILPAFLVVLHRDAGTAGPWWVVCTLAAAWGGDIGGYVAGGLCGRRRMSPRLSPSKTWEGAAGSLALGWATAFTIGRLGRIAAGAVPLMAVTLVAQLLAQAGDLYESGLKRAAGVSDSGRTLGPQGGVLDALDSLCFSAPWMYVAYRLLA